MAVDKVTGKTASEIEELREEYEKKNEGDPDATPFEDQYCLRKIPNLPDDYDGPDRYCTLQWVKQIGSEYICKFHGGAGSPTPEKLDKLAGMTHGMNAAREHLVEDFDDKDQALYDWIVETWPRAYDIDLDENPGAEYDLHRLAAEIVRAERGRGFLIQEGEVTEREVRDDEGRIVRDDDGRVVTEKSEHYLAQMMHRQDKKITELEKELGITRKERLRQDSTDDAVEAMKSFAELGDAFIDRDDKEYDPKDKPWEETNGQDS